jgi:glycosyltransferase involved in cell wall biosynthesis
VNVHKRIWITWENQRRNRELSRAVRSRLFELKEIDEIKNPVKKYVLGLLRTTRILLAERPLLVFCQNPSLILSSFLVTIKRFARIKVVVDAHNAGLFPKEGTSYLLGLLSRYIQRKAELTIVTNEGLKAHVMKNRGRAFTLQDKIPDIPIPSPRKVGEEFNLLFICSYGEDEPYEVVFEAARRLGPEIRIYVTGDYIKKVDRDSVPCNVTLLGYVSEDEYVDMLISVDATIDLTTRENCLVCGAYEAVAVEKPQILSDTKALRSYFRKGVVFAAHNAQAIADSVHRLILEQDRLKQETRELKQLLEDEWEERRLALEEHLARLLNSEKAV